jgi:hypothetical protein
MFHQGRRLIAHVILSRAAGRAHHRQTDGQSQYFQLISAHSFAPCISVWGFLSGDSYSYLRISAKRLAHISQQ